MKINLIIFISQFNHGGAGNSLFRLCTGLSRKLYNINIICLNNCAYEKELKTKNIKVFKINCNRTSLAMMNVKKITQKLISTKYKKNIFISNIYYSNILSVLFLGRLNLKMILIERTPLQELSIYFGINDFVKKQIMKLLIRFTYQYADICISNSKYISKKYNDKYNIQFKTIFPPSFIDIHNFKNKNISPKKIIQIGTVCRLTKEKGLKQFFKTIAKLKFNFNFIIVGDGPENNNLKILSKKLGIEKKITFMGFKNYKEIKIILKKFDIFINCSYFEGFPNSVVESIASGTPVIASQSHGGINEIIKDQGFGHIYQNEKELINLLTRYNLSTKKTSLNKNKTLTHLKKFSFNENIKNYSKVFINI